MDARGRFANQREKKDLSARDKSLKSLPCWGKGARQRNKKTEV